MPEINTNSQQSMEEACRALIKRIAVEEENKLDAMMEPQFFRCQWEDKTLALSFLNRPWMHNPVGNMHGGIIASAFDITMGTLCSCLSDFSAMTPTVSMEICYLRPIPEGTRLIVEAEVTHWGRTVIQLVAKSWLEGEPKRLTATASASYYVVSKKK